MTGTLSSTRRRFLAGSAGMLIAGTLASVPMPAFAQEKTIRAVMFSSLRVMDPIATTNHMSRNHGYMIYDTLVSLDVDGKVQPQMATWTVSDDKLNYEFTLREGLAFHDGPPVTADDVVASLKRWAARDGAAKFLMEATDDVVKTGDNKVTWKLKEPFVLFLDILAKPSTVPSFIMPARIASTPSEEMITEAIGSGPFEFVSSEFQPGVKVVYKRFEGYRPRPEPASGMAGGKVVNVDRVEWLTLPDSQTAINALMAGEINLIENIQIEMIPILEGNPDITVEIRDKAGYQVLTRMNFIHPPFDNVEIRRAAMMALGQQDVMATMISNPDYYSLCGAIFGCGTPFGDETGSESLKNNGDTTKAKEMLKAAGYDGTPVVLIQATDMGPVSNAPVVIASRLRDAGFNVDMQSMDWQSQVVKVRNRNKPAEGGWNMMASLVSVVESNTPLINPLLAPTYIGWLDDPELQKLRGDFVKAANFEEQKEAARKVQARIMDNVVYIPLGNYAYVQARSTKLTGMMPTTVPVFWNIKLED